MKWIPFLIMMIFFEAIANFFAKKFSIDGSKKFFIYAIIFFIVTNIFWLMSLRYGALLSRGIIFFSIASAILGIFIGVFLFKEHFSFQQMVGVFLGFISLFLISF